MKQFNNRKGATIQKAAKAIEESTKFRNGGFAALVNTPSHGANFNLPSKFDPSARHGFERADMLVAPIYEIASFGVMVPFELPRPWEELVSSERLFNYGSPI
ncbi:hypothetical protein Pst134EA_007273 [Puccinia striiformis f. sp. tritici]|uniref:hypothetical protein n=1 Tax=Puccinia striiformis f. sp. tritici TaxID=168172 RepID=UPI002008CBD2|nr:hypothetical protein Pst134EA_007273 [Puccinia striiformis f. sp. tritici]KAH9470008.1 hypothetical protein Pst134EA_007273 [Puccinia striiformis f. sp. tritici]